MELMHGVFAWGAQRDMNRLHGLLLSDDPKAGLSDLVKARRVTRIVALQHIIERLQRFEIELLGFFIIADCNGYVFNHALNTRVELPLNTALHSVHVVWMKPKSASRPAG